MYALVISNKRTARTLTFIKTMAVLYFHACICISNAPHFPRTKGTNAKGNTAHLLDFNPPCQVAGCVVKPTGT